MTQTVEPISLTMDMYEGNPPYPFTEDENCQITGYGHQDPAKFAAEIKRYDVEVGGSGPDELWDWTDQILHTYVFLDEDGERLHQCAATHPGAFPVTTLWGFR